MLWTTSGTFKPTDLEGVAAGLYNPPCMARKRIRDLPEFRRPREKLRERGAEALRDEELLAILLRTGVRGKSALDLARKILKEAGEALPRWTVADFRAIPGVGEAKAAQIVAAFELARRFQGPRRFPIRSPEDVLPYVRHIAHRKQEHVLCLTPNGAGEVIEVHEITVFAPAIADRAAAVILVHNHPSGNLTPSREDLAITRQMVEAGKLLGIDVLDHIILTRDGFLSLKEQGYC